MGICRPECVCKEIASIGNVVLRNDLSAYKCIRDYWNGKELLKLRDDVYNNNLSCFKNCYMPDKTKN